MKKVHFSGTNHVRPAPGSRGYDRVVARGCGGSQDYWGECSCDHGYTWSCDDCPIVQEDNADKQREAEFVGPRQATQVVAISLEDLLTT